MAGADDTHQNDRSGRGTAAPAGRALGVGLPVALGGTLLLAALLVAAPLGRDRLALIANLARALGPLIAFGVGLALPGFPWRAALRDCVVAARRSWRRSDAARAPFRIALGCACGAVGQLTWTFYEQRGRPLPIGSWADPWFLAAYPLLLVGLLGLPQQARPLAARARAALDGILAALVLAAGGWYARYGPALLADNWPVGVELLLIARPIGDLALLVALLWGGLHPPGAALASRRVLAAGLAIVALGDAAFGALVLRGGYVSGTALDAALALGPTLIALAALGEQAALTATPALARGDRRIAPAAPWPLWRALIPYLSLPAIGLLIGHAWHGDAPATIVRGLLVAGALVVLVVIVHQAVVLAEHWRYARDLDAVYRATLGQMAQLDQLQQLATTDPLTGLHNRRALDEAIDDALARCAALALPCAVLLLDLDRFKALNDTHGHLVGDAALRDLAALLRARQRGVARAGRWGGEEFLLLLPATDGRGALALAEDLRATVAAHRCAAAGGIGFTCSIGVAVAPRDGRGRAALIAAADRALYAAKHLGRDQVRSAADPAVAALSAEADAVRAGAH